MYVTKSNLVAKHTHMSNKCITVTRNGNLQLTSYAAFSVATIEDGRGRAGGGGVFFYLSSRYNVCKLYYDVKSAHSTLIKIKL